MPSASKMRRFQELPGGLGIDHVDRSAVIELRRDRRGHQRGGSGLARSLRTIDATLDGHGSSRTRNGFWDERPHERDAPRIERGFAEGFVAKWHGSHGGLRLLGRN